MPLAVPAARSSPGPCLTMPRSVRRLPCPAVSAGALALIRLLWRPKLWLRAGPRRDSQSYPWLAPINLTPVFLAFCRRAIPPARLLSVQVERAGAGICPRRRRPRRAAGPGPRPRGEN